MPDALANFVKPWVPKPIRRGLRNAQSLDWLPHNSWADYLWALRRFRKEFKRFPRKTSRLYFDALFQVRIHELTMPERVRITDKEHVKSFVRDRIGDRHVVPTLAVLRSADEAVAFQYPDECVIKPTHMSGEAIFHHPGDAIDRQRVARWFARNYYTEVRELNYRTLDPKVIVEPYVLGPAVGPAPHFNFICIDGKPRSIRVIVPTATASRRSFFDCDWRLLPFNFDYEPLPPDTPPPENLHQMIDVAARLSAGFSYLRVDLYSDGRQTYVGELTNCDSGSFGGQFSPPTGEEQISRLLWPDRW